MTGAGLHVVPAHSEQGTDRHTSGAAFLVRQHKVIKGFKGKKGVPFDAAVTFDTEYNPVFLFPRDKGHKKG